MFKDINIYRRSIISIIGIIITILSIMWIKSLINWEKVISSLNIIDSTEVFFLIFFFSVSFYLRIRRYISIQIFLKNVQKNILYQAFCLNYISNIFLPLRLGEIFRIFYINSKAQVSKIDSIIIIFIEKIFDLFIIFLFLTLVSFLWFEVINYRELFPNIIFDLEIRFEFILLLLLILTGVAFIIYKNKNRFYKICFFRKILSKFLIFRKFLNSPKILLSTVFLTFFSWLFEGLTFYFAAKFIELDVSILVAFLFATAVALGSSVPSSPGSIGVFEASVLFVIILFKLDPSKGLSLGIIVHLVQIISVMVFSILSFLFSKKFYEYLSQLIVKYFIKN